jgi:hypothetical protein
MVSIRALRSTELPVRWVHGLSWELNRRECGADRPPFSSAGLRMGWSCGSAVPLHLQRNVIGWTLLLQENPELFVTLIITLKIREARALVYHHIRELAPYEKRNLLEAKLYVLSLLFSIYTSINFWWRNFLERIHLEDRKLSGSQGDRLLQH